MACGQHRHMTACKRDFRGAIKDGNYRAQHRADRHHRNPDPSRAGILRNPAPDLARHGFASSIVARRLSPVRFAPSLTDSIADQPPPHPIKFRPISPDASVVRGHATFPQKLSHPTGINLTEMETTGCGTAIVTPFRTDGSVDEPALWALVNWQIESGIDFLVACGSTGEAATLEEDEWLDAVRIVVEAAAGRVPVWGGCTHNETRPCCARPRCSTVPGLAPCFPPTPTTTSRPRKASSSTFSRWRRGRPASCLRVQRSWPHRGNLEPETVLAWPNRPKHSGYQGSHRQPGPVRQVGPSSFPGVSRSFPATTTLPWGDRHGSPRTHQRRLQRGPSRSRGWCAPPFGHWATPAIGAELRATFRSELLGLEPRSRQDRSDLMGRCTDSCVYRWCRPPRHPRTTRKTSGRNGPAQARAPARGLALRGLLTVPTRFLDSLKSFFERFSTFCVFSRNFGIRPGSTTNSRG